MIELIEIVGEKNINEGSFLDFDKAWSAKVKEFKDRRISQGHASKLLITHMKNQGNLTNI